MQKVYFTTEPGQILYMPQDNGTAEVWLRRNINQEESEEGTVWTADEVFFRTRLTEEEVIDQAENYFIEEPETTIEDLVEALDILTGIVIGEEDE